MIFENPDFGQVRTMTDEKGEPWFVGKDVAEILGYAKPENAIATHVDDEDKTSTLIQGSGSNYKSKAIIINESGLYSLILCSKMEKARQFKHWVTAEVLPQIRKTGGYIPVKAEDDEQTIMAKAMLIAQRTLAEKEALLEAQRPKVQFADAITASDSSILIGDLAKLITQNGHEIGRTRLFKWLRDNGYLFKKECRPYQKWVEKGYFELSVSLIETHHGAKEVVTTKVTTKGQEYFLKTLSVFALG